MKKVLNILAFTKGNAQQIFENGIFNMKGLNINPISEIRHPPDHLKLL